MKANPSSLAMGFALGACALAMEGRLHLDPASSAERVTPIVEVVREVGPTVVNLYSNVEYQQVFGFRSEAASLGSGVIVHPSGIVVTNAHVLTANLDRFRIREIQVSYRPRWTGAGDDEVRRFEAQVLGFNRQHDLALLKILAPGPFPAATLGTSSDLMVGETVVAVGNPFGREGSVTHGIISATNRHLEGPTGRQFEDLIQTDASLNAGNSGGPLFNILGELIGINQAIGTDARLGRAEGQGLAIPVDRVRTLLEEQFSVYELQHSYSGLKFANRDGQVVVVEVDPDSPGQRAGLRPGDQMIQVEDYAVTDLAAFNLSLLTYPSDATIPLTVQRGAQRMEVKLAIVSVAKTVNERLGVEMDKNPRSAPHVVQVTPEGPADRIGLRSGDLIVELEGKEIHSIQDLFEVLVDRRPEEVLQIVVRRYASRYRYEDWEGRIRL